MSNFSVYISTETLPKKIQSYDRKFVVKQYMTSLEVHYRINPWEEPVASDKKRNNDSCLQKNQGL